MKKMNKWFAGSSEGSRKPEWEEEEKWWETYEAILNETGSFFEEPRTKRDNEDGAIELRAAVNGMTLRVKWDISGWDDPGYVIVELQYPDKIDPLTIMWDPKEVPKQKDRDKDWGDDDEVRIFVDKAIYLEGDEDIVNSMIANLNAIPEDFRKKLYDAMQGIPLFNLLRNYPASRYTGNNKNEKKCCCIRRIWDTMGLSVLKTLYGMVILYI